MPVRDRAVYLAARAFTTLVGALPGWLVRRLGRWVGSMVFLLAGKKRRMVQRHMRRVLGPEAGTWWPARAVFASYGRYWAETLWIRPERLPEMFEHMRVAGWENFFAARDSPTGAIFALPHLGNWEAAGARSAFEGAKALAVVEALGNELLVKWFVGIRNAMDIDVVVATPGSKVTRELIAHLKRGGAIALMADRDLGGRGPTVTFFGEETTMPAGPMALAERTGALLVPMAPYFREPAGYRMVLHEPIPVPTGGTREERVAVGTQVLAGKFEEMIREAPTQWHLLVPNWPSDRA